eukprot:TRINITY_DN19199_c0_g1_i1.p3 TRINITY_DN19199_c0_g1~~TRINITY_DN19199_c0_g1_i1.p3  ORF type:complete len:119 (+),score=8.09 TRINITY_DN19199_c0_g1_i1:153-509(+)
MEHNQDSRQFMKQGFFLGLLDKYISVGVLLEKKFWFFDNCYGVFDEKQVDFLLQMGTNQGIYLRGGKKILATQYFVFKIFIMVKVHIIQLVVTFLVVKEEGKITLNFVYNVCKISVPK